MSKGTGNMPLLTESSVPFHFLITSDTFWWAWKAQWGKVLQLQYVDWKQDEFSSVSRHPSTSISLTKDFENPNFQSYRILLHFINCLPVSMIKTVCCFILRPIEKNWQQRIPSLPTQCNENPIYVFPEKELPVFSHNFHIHVTVGDLYIPRVGPHIFLFR